MVEAKPRDIRCHTHVKAIIDVGDNVDDDDGPTRTPPHLTILHTHFPALPCDTTVPYPT